MSPITQKIENKIVTAEPVSTHGRYGQAFNGVVSGADTALALMTTIEKTALLLNETRVAGSAGTYIGGTTVPYLYNATYALANNVQLARQEGLTSKLAARITHGVFDVSAMVGFVLNFFTKQLEPLHYAILFNTAAEATDAGIRAKDALEARELYVIAKHDQNSPEILSALNSRMIHSSLKSAKAFLAALGCYFSSYAIILGTAVASASTVAVTGLASAALDILAYMQKNGSAEYFADIQEIKQVHA